MGLGSGWCVKTFADVGRITIINHRHANSPTTQPLNTGTLSTLYLYIKQCNGRSMDDHWSGWRSGTHQQQTTANGSYVARSTQKSRLWEATNA